MKKLLLFVSLILVSPVVRAEEDIIISTLLSHVMTVTQFQSGQTNVALMDSVVQIGSINGHSILDLQAGFSGNVAPEPGEEKNFLLAGGFLKVSSLIKDKIHFPEQWQFLNSLEHGPTLFYDFKDKTWEGSYQVGLAFGLNPKP